MAIQRAKVVCDEDGMLIFSDEKTNVKIALRLPSGRVVDLRLDPTFVAITPCPYCIATNGTEKKGQEHDPLCHIDPSLGSLGEAL